MLSRADFELFAWEKEDLKGYDQRVKVIGAPLELAQNLYTGLQNMYNSSDPPLSIHNKLTFSGVVCIAVSYVLLYSSDFWQAEDSVKCTVLI